VITTGGSTLQAIAACREAGLKVVRVVVLVDRQEMNGRENILREVDAVDALILRDDVMALHARK
jgi:orotate phosphoribosyltransferase